MKGLFDKNVVIATVLLVGWLLIYTVFLAPKHEPVENGDEQAATEQAAPADGTDSQAAQTASDHAPSAVADAAPVAAPETDAVLPEVVADPTAEIEPIEEQRIAIETEPIDLVLTSDGGRIASWRLNRYRETIDKDSPGVQMIPDPAFGEKYAAGVAFTDPAFGLPEDLPMTVASHDGSAVVFTGTTRTGLDVRKEVVVDPESYTATIRFEVANRTAQAIAGTLYTPLYDTLTTAASAGGCGPAGCANERMKQRQFEAYVGTKLIQKQINDKLTDPGLTSGVYWTGFGDPYFLAAAAADEAETAGLYTALDAKNGSVETRLIEGRLEIPAGETREHTFTIYLGPKTDIPLVAAGHDLRKAIDYGWFTIIADLFVGALKFFYRYIPNWGVSIIIVTIIIKTLLYPLTLKSYKSMNEMQRIQPLIKDLRERLKDDKQKMNEEMMRLYKEYKVNPAGGCLPLVLQFPIFIAFYRVLYQSIELRHSAFAFWIHDLSAPDPYYVLPIVMGASQWVSQKMTPTTGDPAQQKMMQLMPVFFTFLFLNFPSGLVLYWLVNNLLTIGQQKWIRYKNPVTPIELPKPKEAPAVIDDGTRKKKKKKGRK